MLVQVEANLKGGVYDIINKKYVNGVLHYWMVWKLL